jgi:WXG100 family type VII secretion target
MVNVHFQALAQGADDVRTAHNALVAEKDGMDQFLLKLRGTWHGGAGMNWQTTQNHWNAACDEVNMVLLNLFNALEAALGNYQSTELGLEQMWGGH